MLLPSLLVSFWWRLLIRLLVGLVRLLWLLPGGHTKNANAHNCPHDRLDQCSKNRTEKCPDQEPEPTASSEEKREHKHPHSTNDAAVDTFRIQCPKRTSQYSN